MKFALLSLGFGLRFKEGAICFQSIEFVKARMSFQPPHQEIPRKRDYRMNPRLNEPFEIVPHEVSLPDEDAVPMSKESVKREK